MTVSGAQTTEKEYDADTLMDVGALALDNVLPADSISKNCDSRIYDDRCGRK